MCASLSAGLLRQATYTTTRLGIYTILFERMTGSDGRPPSFVLKVPQPSNMAAARPWRLLAKAASAHSPKPAVSLCRP